MPALIDCLQQQGRAYPPPWWRALLSQVAGVMVATILDVLWPMLFDAGLTLPSWLGAQAIAAAACAWVLGLARWWWLLQLAFGPALAAGLAASLPPLSSALMLLLLVAIYGGTQGTRVPLYLTGSAAVRAVVELMPAQDPFSFIDLGCGTATVLAALARQRPLARLDGVERAPLPYLVAKIRSLLSAHAYQVCGGNLWDADLSGYDVVYAYLSPLPMERLWQKARAEMRPGALLVSYRFAVPGVVPTKTVNVGGKLLYAWRIS